METDTPYINHEQTARESTMAVHTNVTATRGPKFPHPHINRRKRIGLTDVERCFLRKVQTTIGWKLWIYQVKVMNMR